jgi:hypothetical protein
LKNTSLAALWKRPIFAAFKRLPVQVTRQSHSLDFWSNYQCDSAAQKKGMNVRKKESSMEAFAPTRARIHILPWKFVPGEGYVGSKQDTPTHYMDWEDGAVNLDQGDPAEELWKPFDVTLSGVSGWEKIPALQRWHLTTPQPHATVKVRQTENPFGGFYLYEHSIIICGMTAGYIPQVAGCIREITKVLTDELLMQLLLGQLLGWRPQPIGSSYARMLYDVVNGGNVRKHRGELIELACLIEQSTRYRR